MGNYNDSLLGKRINLATVWFAFLILWNCSSSAGLQTLAEHDDFRHAADERKIELRQKLDEMRAPKEG